MEEFLNHEEKRNKLRTENELKKAKLSLEHGGEFFTPPDSKLPPEVESEWLDNIQKFEDAFANRKTVLLYDLIGKPAFKPVHSIPPDEIKNELEKIINILSRTNIAVDTICKVEERELYRFITEELFKHETDDMFISGMTTHFTYEEFHPNHEYDIKNHCQDFLRQLFRKKSDLNPDYLPVTKKIKTKKEIITIDQLLKKLNDFRDAFDSLRLKRFEITSMKIRKIAAHVNFDIAFSGKMEGNREKTTVEGKGKFSMKYKWEYWSINGMEFPALSI